MDNNNTIETNMILTDDKEVVIDIEMSKLIYEYILLENSILDWPAMSDIPWTLCNAHYITHGDNFMHNP